jgi:CubicO group peptidase (beta-lactamase class C family)
MAAQARPQQACDYSAAMGGVSCVVLNQGRVIHERYSRNSPPDQALSLASGTKSFSGIAAAAAVQDGLFQLDDKVSDILTEWKLDGRRDITIRQLLSLTSGIQTKKPGLGSLRLDFDQAIQLPLEHPPGAHFAYGQAPFQIFAAMMERKLNGETLLDYMQRRFLNTLGVQLTMREPVFRLGDPSWGGGASLSARDWAKFGEFVRLGGKWNGMQLVDASALAQNFVGSPVHGGYGLTWWLKPPAGSKVPLGGTTENATDLYTGGAETLPIKQLWMAAGAGKQRLYILPDHNLVAVRQTGNILLGERSNFSDVEFLRLLLVQPPPI